MGKAKIRQIRPKERLRKKQANKPYKKPEKKDLRGIYKRLLTSDTSIRCAALTEALRWFDTAREWATEASPRKKRFTPETFKAFSAIATQRLKASSAVGEAQEKILRGAIESYEKALVGAVRVKPLLLWYKRLDRYRERLQKKEARLTRRFDTVFTLMEEALVPKNAKGETVRLVVSDAIKTRHATRDARTLQYSKVLAKEILTKFKQEGLLAVVVQEVQFLAFLACEMDQTTLKFVYDPSKELGATTRMFANLVTYAKAHPKIARRLLRARRRPRKEVSGRRKK